MLSVNLSSGYEIVYKVRLGVEESEIVQNSKVNITGSLPDEEGTYTIVLEAKSGYVEVSYK